MYIYSYTKALDHIKVLRKEKGNALKVEENELEHLKLNYSKAGRVRERKEEIVKSMTETQHRIAVLDGGEIERLVDQMTSLMDQHRSLQSLKAQLDSSRLEQDMVKKNMVSIKENLELYHGMRTALCWSFDESLNLFFAYQSPMND
jgi:hypothetical protein